MSQTVFAAFFMIIFFAVMIGIGFYYNKKEKVSSSSDDYILAGRRAPLLIVAGSFFATMVSTGTVAGYAGSGYSNGISAYWSGGCFMTASMWAGIWIIPRLRATGITTVPELFDKYFGGKHRILALILSLGRDLGVIASVVLVLGQIFQSLFGMNFWLSIILTAGVVILFTASGGMWAVLLTDTIQAAFIALGTTILIPLGIYKAGGFAKFVAQVPVTHSDVFSVGMSQTLGWFLVGTFTLLGYQTMLQRGLAAKDDKTAQQAFFFGGLLGLFWYAVPFVTGVVAKVLFPDITASNAFYSMASLFGDYGNVFFLTVLLMSGMSTVSSCILTTTSNITLDLYKRFIRPDASEKNIVILQRCCLLFIVLLCTWIGQIYPYVVELFWIGGRLMASGLAPVLVTLLLWSKARRAPISTFFAMLGGAGACLWAQMSQAAAATAAAGTGAVVFVWKMDPILFGLPVCFAILIIGVLLETKDQTPEILLAHAVK
jgi:SSS family solute:Na+ symporter